MSPLSLSSLLNPEAAAASKDPSSPPSPKRKDSLPAIVHHVHHRDHHPRLPSHRDLRQNAYHLDAMDDSANALNGLPKSGASPTTSSAQWHADGSNAAHVAPMEPSGAPMDAPRKNSSPTLDQYHVSSRSPEQMRPTILSPVQSEFTLPPMQLQGLAHHEEQTHASTVQVSSLGTSHSPDETAEAAAPTSLDHDAERASHASQGEDFTSQAQLPHLTTNTSKTPVATDRSTSSPTRIKQETVPTPRAISPANANPPPSSQQSAITSLKNEQGIRTQSPLRESSVPVPSTEIGDQSIGAKKRPAPPRAKKGTASIMKKALPSKKRKVELKRSETPSSSRNSRAPGFKTGSTKGTPANSSPARFSRSESADPDDDADDDDDDGDGSDDGGTYCICRKSDSGTFMIGCDGNCDDWFHGKCVGIQERDKNLIDKYMCPNCTEAGIGLTTWKRMCRRRGCRQPARVTKIKGKDASKYCSEECGVLYFREMVGKTRQREESPKERSKRRRIHTINDDSDAADEDLGARGGVLAAGEVKGLLDSAKSAQDFKKLGEGVLSPPDTPDGKETSKEEEYTQAETEALSRILTEKDEARRRHQLLKDRVKFVTMVKQAADRTATEREVKSTQYCGYDPRIEWTEMRFVTWRDSAAGKHAFDLSTLATENSGGAKDGDGDTMIGDADEPDTKAELDICDRKKCARHDHWSKLAIDDLRYENSNNSDHMRALDKEEREIKERAALRGKAGNAKAEGYAEIHGLGVTNGSTSDTMDVDVALKEPATVVETVEAITENAPTAVPA